MAAGPSTPRVSREALERRLFINASPEAVWRALHGEGRDPACYALAVLGPATPGWPAAGSQRSGRIRLGPIRVRVAAESLDARPARRFRLALDGSSVGGEARWELVAASGGTRVACALHLSGRSRVGRILLRLDQGALGRRLEAELARLKHAAEDDARGG